MVKKKRGKKREDLIVLYIILGILLGLLVISVYFLVQEETPLYAPGSEYLVWFDVDGNGVIEESDKVAISDALYNQVAEDGSGTISESIYEGIVAGKRGDCSVSCDDNFNFNDDGLIEALDLTMFYQSAGHPDNIYFNAVYPKIMAAVTVRIGAVDTDRDGIGDTVDNCPSISNSNQLNTDGDGIGNVCDNCPNDANNDIDGDGVCGDVDNCPSVANPGQEDTDLDGLGDACEIVCVDSDVNGTYPDGKNYNLKGDVCIGVQCQIDSCLNSAGLKEYYLEEGSCNLLTDIFSVDYDCPFGCVDGACLSVAPVCSANYTLNNTSCVNDEVVRYPFVLGFSNIGCGLANVSLPANATLHRNCGNDSFIGDLNDIEDERVKIDEILVDDDNIDFDENFSEDGELPVEFVDEDGVVRISFDFDFEDEELNLKGVSVKKQSSSANYGYMIVGGIDVEKTVVIDKLVSSSNSVCIRDSSSVTSTSSFTDNCGSSSEELVKCDGEWDFGYKCGISGNLITVYGLEHSAVREYTVDYSSDDSDGSSSSGGRSSGGGSSVTGSQDTSRQTLPTSSYDSGDGLGLDDEKDIEDGVGDDSKTFLWIAIVILGVGVLVVLFLIINFSLKKSEKKKFFPNNNIRFTPSNQKQSSYGFSGR